MISLIFIGIAITSFFFISFFYSKNAHNNQSLKDYFLADRSLGIISVAFSLVATQLGGGMLLGTSQQAFLYGLSGIAYTFGMVLGFLLLGCGVAQRLRQLNVATTAEIFYTKYKSTSLQTFASILSMITLFGLLTAQFVGAKLLFNSLSLTSPIIFVIFWLVVIAYTSLGGLYTVVVTDILQVLFIISIFGGIFFYALWCNPILFAQMFTSSATSMPLSLATISSIIVIPALFSLIEQDLAQRFFAASSQRVAAISAFVASTTLFIFALIPVYLGIQAQQISELIGVDESPLVPIITHITNSIIATLATLGILAAVMSTADSLLNAISSNLVQDFKQYIPYNKIRFAQISSVLIGIFSLSVSFALPSNIIAIIIKSYGLSVSCLAVPLIIAYFSNNVKKIAAYLSVIAGALTFVVLELTNANLPVEFIALTFSLIAYCVGHFISKK